MLLKTSTLEAPHGPLSRVTTNGGRIKVMRTIVQSLRKELNYDPTILKTRLKADSKKLTGTTIADETSAEMGQAMDFQHHGEPDKKNKGKRSKDKTAGGHSAKENAGEDN